MREANFPYNFNFGDVDDRLEVVCGNREMLSPPSKDVSFAHFNVGDGQATVAGVYIDGVLYYGLSFCCPTDNFNKMRGRALAIDSFVMGNQRSALCGNFLDTPPSLALKEALKHWLSGKRHFPKWVKNAAITLRGNYRGE